MRVKVYVEGGGDHNRALAIQCRQGFSSFFERSGLKRRMPRVVACGGRGQAYDRFRTAHEASEPDDFPVLLVDSEAPAVADAPWDHVARRPGDGWRRPRQASDDQLHLMIQAMEAWFHADKEALAEFYQRDFRMNSLSSRTNIEVIPKEDLFDGLQQATRACQKGAYSKGKHSFQILAKIDPAKVKASLPSADRLLSVLDRVCAR